MHPALARGLMGAKIPANILWTSHLGAIRHSFVVSASHPSEERGNEPLKSVSELPGPLRLPVIGNVLSMALHKDFERMKFHKLWISWIKEYGHIFRVALPGLPKVVVITRPEDTETMFRATMKNPVRPGADSLKKIRHKDSRNFFHGKTGILVEDGEEWWRVRSRVQAPMMKIKNVAMYLPQMDQVSLKFVERIKDLQHLHGEMPDDFDAELRRWALESVSLVALNRRMGCLELNWSEDALPNRLVKTVDQFFHSFGDAEISAQLWRLFPTPAYRRMEKAHDTFLELADSCIRETEEALKMKSDDSEISIMEQLLKTPGLTRNDVVTMILDMIFAGIDTTSNTVGFALYLLAKNPEAQTKLQEELDQVLGDGKETLSINHLNQMSYLKAVVKESLRIYPLDIGTIRTLTEDVPLSGYLVPKGFTVLSLNFQSRMDEKLFPRPAEFIPDRWLRDRPMGAIPAFASLPFSYGPRMCIGRRIAEQEIYTLLARAMHRFNLDYKYGDMEVVTKLFFNPGSPLKFSFTQR